MFHFVFMPQILGLLNQIPATSRKYQFAMAMADQIMEGNARDGRVELLEVNQQALSSAFACTLSLLHRSLKHPHGSADSGDWLSRVLRAIPMGSYVSPYVKGLNSCITSVTQTLRRGALSVLLDKWRDFIGEGSGCVVVYEGADDVVAEKLAQELFWITNKIRAYGAVDEAMVQWSYASALASLAFSANPRVQGYIVKISGLYSLCKI